MLSLASTGTAHTWCTDIHAVKNTHTYNVKINKSFKYSHLLIRLALFSGWIQ